MITSSGESNLAHRLERRAAALQLDCAAVSCFERDVEIDCAYVRKSAAPFDSDTPVGAACLAKLTTSLLVFRAATRGALALTSTLGDLPGFTGAECGDAADISLTQLLDHTHGLDGADVELAPTTSAGLIDSARLLQLIQTREPLHAPGALYSYGHFGHLLIGAALERRYACPYSQLLESELFPAAGIQARVASQVCPASGAGLALSAKDALKLLKLYGISGCGLQGLLASRRDLPGYNWRDSGFTCGWRCEADDWFVWSGARPGAEALVLRWQPANARGIAVSGRSNRVKMLAEQLAEDLWKHPAGSLRKLPGLAPGTRPETTACVGTYEDSATRVTVLGSGSSMRMRVEPQSDGETQGFFERTLRAAGPDLYFTMPPDRSDFYFAQFLRSANAVTASYLWNGMRLWRRRQ